MGLPVPNHPITLLDTFLNLLFPLDCVLCASRVTHWRTGAICDACEQSLERQPRPFCERCGFPAPAIRGLCGACIAGQTRYDFGRAALLFNESLRGLIHRFKYDDRVSLARPLGRALRQCLETEGFAPDFAVPVPLHPKRERRRGYNQAELLASRLGLPVVRSGVRRRRNTETQTGMTRPQRSQNVRGAFECRKPIAGCALVVDDIQTTGATVNELARVLKRGGASRVEVLTLARVGIGGRVDAKNESEGPAPREIR